MAATAGIVAIMAIAAGAAGMAGAISEGNAAKRAAETEAKRIELIGEEKKTDVQRRRYLTLGAQRQAFSARGVSLQGSPLLILAETNALADRDLNRISGDVGFQASEARRAGSFAQSQSRVKAAGIGLSSLANAATAYASASGGHKPDATTGSTLMSSGTTNTSYYGRLDTGVQPYVSKY